MSISQLLWLSYVLLWCIVVALSGATLVMYRRFRLWQRTQVALGRLGGPQSGTRFPVSSFTLIDGHDVTIGAQGTKAQLLVFASLNCTKCQATLATLSDSAASLIRRVDIIVLYRGVSDDVLAHARLLAPEIQVVAIGRQFGRIAHDIPEIPYSVLLDREGVVRHKGAIQTTIRAIPPASQLLEAIP